MIKIAVTGASGRMGKTHIRVIQNDPECELAGASEHPRSPSVGKDAGVNSGMEETGITIQPELSMVIDRCDAVIDFSSSKAFDNHLKSAVKYRKAFICGTTGLSDKQMEDLRTASKSIPCIWAPNFSIGINLISNLTKTAAKILNDGFDVEIIEAHHRFKKDAPSGTALLLLNDVQSSINKETEAVYGREGHTGERRNSEIGMSVIRGGDIVGDHTVLFAGDGERIEITHKASSRETFSKGAVKCAKVLSGKEKGFYTMKDILGLS